MNRQRLTVLFMATAVLAGAAGLLNDGGCRIMSRTWADRGPAATLAAKAKPGGAIDRRATTGKGTKTKGKELKVVHGRTWT